MAHLTIRGEAALNVIRVGRALEILHMTRGACGIGSREVVIVVYVTGNAGHGNVRTG